MSKLLLPGGSNPLSTVIDATFGWEPPDIIEFVTSDKYLNRGQILYPRQATLLKVIFLQKELFTQYDYDVIGEWIQSYEDTSDQREELAHLQENGGSRDDVRRLSEGQNGISPDILERIDICRDEGRNWFKECVVVMGRRAGKGHIGAISGSYVLWSYMGKGDPHGYYGVDRDKRLACQVFAGKKEQAKTNQWADISNFIMGGPCFSPYISRHLSESLTIRSPHDIARMVDRQVRGVESEADLATFEILPKESTLMAARGPASFMQFYDEMAHVVASGANRSAQDVYQSATPSLDQFGIDSFIYEPSSPWQRNGQFYANYRKSLEINEDGSPGQPQVMMIQLASWDIYKDWELASQLYARPETIYHSPIAFNPLKRAIQTYDKEMENIERANPETFAVERRSHFAAAMNAYLKEERVNDIWKPWPNEDRPMKTESKGILSYTYRAHGDPSKSGANFGFAIAHMEGPDDRGLNHVVFDVITAYRPGDFEDNNREIDYEFIGEEMKGYMDDFMPSLLTFDQFNSVNTIQELRRYARTKNYPKRVDIEERTATSSLNWKTFETFKTAVGLGLVHGPYMELADLELKYLQDLGGRVEKPSTGPVQTKDVADCIAIVTYELLGQQLSAFIGKTLANVPLGAGLGGGLPIGMPGDGVDTQVYEQLGGFSRSRTRNRVNGGPARTSIRRGRR